MLRYLPAVRQLAELTGQSGAADDCDYFLSGPHTAHMDPVLVLSHARPGEPSVRTIGRAVLLYQYKLLNRGLRAYTSADASGRRTVFAPAGQRIAATASAMATLLDFGAHFVHLACRPAAHEPATPAQMATFLAAQPLPPNISWTCTRQEVPSSLALGPTFHATLARIGRRTRANLRYFRWRTGHEVGYVYIPNLQITLREFLAFNRTCMFPVPDKVATWRLQVLRSLADPLLAGLQDGQGRWLLIAGGRRRGEEVEIDWQMNSNAHPELSLSTVFRSCLIEAEIARGSRELYVEDGTLPSLRRETVVKITGRRNSAYVQLLRRFGSRFSKENKDVAQILNDPDLVWHSS